MIHLGAKVEGPRCPACNMAVHDPDRFCSGSPAADDEGSASALRGHQGGGVTAPAFRRVASGLYRTEDGRFELSQLIGDGERPISPAAWNVDWSTDFSYEHRYTESPLDRSGALDSMIVDGAATKRDALALFAEWWLLVGCTLPYAENA